MNNYKIKVNNEAESKESQELFFELGFQWYKEDKGVFWETTSGFIFANANTKFLMGGVVVDVDTYLPVTIAQLRNLVAEKKNENGLISGADAKLAWANGHTIEYFYDQWVEITQEFDLGVFNRFDKFRLKPRTITLNVEIPACGTSYKNGQLIWILNSLELNEYCSVILDESDELPAYWWETEEEIKQVVAALRGGIKA